MTTDSAHSRALNHAHRHVNIIYNHYVTPEYLDAACKAYITALLDDAEVRERLAIAIVEMVAFCPENPGCKDCLSSAKKDLIPIIGTLKRIVGAT